MLSFSQVVIPAFRKLRQEDYHEFEANLGYRIRPCMTQAPCVFLNLDKKSTVVTMNMKSCLARM